MLLHYAIKQLQGIDAWVGKNYDTTMPSLLILGQSDSGVKTRLSTYVPDWIAERVTDRTFTAIYNACTASKSSVFHNFSKQKQNFWDAIAFYNFIPKTLGPIKPGPSPTVLDLKSGVRPLHLVLDVLRPHGVFIMGLAHSDYSRPVVQAHGIPHVVVPHTRSGVTSKFISKSFNILIRTSTPKQQTP